MRAITTRTGNHYATSKADYSRLHASCTVAVVALATSCGMNAHAISPEDAVHDLAQGCFSIQSPATGRFLQPFHQGGPIDNGLSYRFADGPVTQAERFFFKPTSFQNYLITGRDGRFLATHLPGQISAGTAAGSFAEWKISAQADSQGGHLFSFRGNALNMTLRHNTWRQTLYFFDLFNPWNWWSENRFRLVAQSDCTPFPEAELNVADAPGPATGSVDLPIRGFVDPHTHITSYEFMGGKMMAGKPFHRWGIQTALKDSSDVHGPRGALDIIGNLQAYGDVNFRYDTRGYPDFPFWPNYKQQSHMGYYYRWIERAHKGGLKLMVSHLVENEVLCNVQKTINPASWINPNSCNTMESVDLQIRRLHEMQAYIDAQAGGPGEGFFRLVSSPAQARRVIADGKMAVLMGIEVSELFNCGYKDQCSEATIEAGLQKAHAAGVRVLYPVHRLDNQLGGARLEDGLINVGNWLSTGHFFETEACDAETRGAWMTNGFPLIGQVPVLKQILDLAGANPYYDESRPHCNVRGLTRLGNYLVNRMIDLGMIIEIDHMSNKTAAAVMDIVDARNYSGVVSSHSHMNRDRLGGVHDLTRRIALAGGVLAPYNSASTSLASDISEYLDVVETTPYLHAVPFATDMSGLGSQAAPRSDTAVNPLVYPFTTESGVIVDRQKTGNRVFDLNTDGVAHYGLLPDHLQDIREQTSDRIYESVMNSAEGYLQMWERAQAGQ
ncbi:hypothetical protein [Allohahella sp. A8]|uniref:hypothetical protein n=1 Tax=Allohahella sp. A8 TaxID=3141461 RepID=UPI003A808FE7